MFVFVNDVGCSGVYCCGNGVCWVDFFYCFSCVVYCLMYQWYCLLGVNLGGVVWGVVIVGG